MKMIAGVCLIMSMSTARADCGWTHNCGARGCADCKDDGSAGFHECCGGGGGGGGGGDCGWVHTCGSRGCADCKDDGSPGFRECCGGPPPPPPPPVGPTPPPTPAPPAPTGTVVSRYGQLKVQGNKVVGKDGQQVRLQGMSLFWSQWMDKYWNKDTLAWLVKDWHIEIVRAAMGVDQGGYLNNPGAEKAKLERVVDACIELGIYVIIDWHLESSDAHVDQAKPFFSEMAQKYGKQPNVLFETWNEPKHVGWNTIKSYHEQVVGVIRQHSDNICILGNEDWSSNPAGAAQNPVSGENLAYTVHFYAASSKVPGRVQGALDAGHAVWATEWGTCESSGNGRVDTGSSAAWMSYLKEHGISSTNWAIEDKAESCAALHGGASGSGGWSESQLTQSGQWVRNTIRGSVLNNTDQAVVV